jgi:hypothetical protein
MQIFWNNYLDIIDSKSGKLQIYSVESLKRVKAITGQKQGNHTIRTVFFITVRTVLT